MALDSILPLALEGREMEREKEGIWERQKEEERDRVRDREGAMC